MKKKKKGKRKWLSGSWNRGSLLMLSSRRSLDAVIADVGVVGVVGVVDVLFSVLAVR